MKKIMIITACILSSTLSAAQPTRTLPGEVRHEIERILVQELAILVMNGNHQNALKLITNSNQNKQLPAAARRLQQASAPVKKHIIGKGKQPQCIKKSHR